MKSCEKCEYLYDDWILDDDGEEWEFFACEKGHDIDSNHNCKDYHEYKPKSYKEKDTKCDNCEFLKKCMKECQSEDVPYLDCTTSQDTRRHIIVGNINCYKNKEQHNDR